MQFHGSSMYKHAVSVPYTCYHLTSRAGRTRLLLQRLRVVGDDANSVVFFRYKVFPSQTPTGLLCRNPEMTY